MSARKPHRDFAGYVAELRNCHSGGHTIILDCKRAADQGTPLVENFVEEGGRYQVLCNEHSTLVYTSSLPAARECMKDATEFCLLCRVISGEISAEHASLNDHELAQVNSRLTNGGGQTPCQPQSSL